MEPVTLRSDRLVLSVHTESDVPDIVAYATDPDVIAGTPVPVPYGEPEAVAYLQHVRAGWQSGERFEFAIRRATDPVRMLGSITLFGIWDGSAEVGYAVHPSGRGSGLVTEAVSTVLDWAFAPAPDGLDLVRVQWRALATNTASARLAQRIGFHYEGRRRSAVLHRGVRHDELTAALLRDDPRGQPVGWPSSLA